MSLVRHGLAEKTLDMCLIFVLPCFRKTNVLKADVAGPVEEYRIRHTHHLVGSCYLTARVADEGEIGGYRIQEFLSEALRSRLAPCATLTQASAIATVGKRIHGRLYMVLTINKHFTTLTRFYRV
jgi:hypothetical protein